MNNEKRNARKIRHINKIKYRKLLPEISKELPQKNNTNTQKEEDYRNLINSINTVYRIYIMGYWYFAQNIRKATWQLENEQSENKNQNIIEAFSQYGADAIDWDMTSILHPENNTDAIHVLDNIAWGIEECDIEIIENGIHLTSEKLSQQAINTDEFADYLLMDMASIGNGFTSTIEEALQSCCEVITNPSIEYELRKVTVDFSIILCHLMQSLVEKTFHHVCHY